MTSEGNGDPRIEALRKAAVRMKEGDFGVDVPAGDDDAVGRLGTALHELGQALNRQLTLLRELSELAVKVNAGLTLDEVLEHVYAEFRSHIPYDRIGFSLLEDDGKTLRARWAKSAAPVMKIAGDYTAPMAGSSLQDIIRTGQPRIINDLEEYLQEHPGSQSTALIVEEGMRSSFTCPLVANGKPVGFMFFSSMKKNTYRDLHVEVFEHVAGQLSMTVEKANLYQRLLELNDLKNKFLGIAAHDLRSPLGVVKTYASVLKSEMLGKEDDKHKNIYVRMERSCEKMLALINDLLDVSAIESGKLQLEKERVDLKALLAEAVENNGLIAESKGIKVEADLAEELPEVSVDPKRINQVVDNLIGNAIKFSESGTTITMRAKPTEGGVSIAVADQGQGIPADELPKLFEAFSRTSVRPTGGEKSTGLGLAICKKIVDMHDGRIDVESEVGKGTTFTIFLPLDGAQSDA